MSGRTGGGTDVQVEIVCILGSTRFAGAFIVPQGQQKRIMLKREY